MIVKTTKTTSILISLIVILLCSVCLITPSIFLHYYNAVTVLSGKSTTLLYQDDLLASSSLHWSPNGNELAIYTNRGMPPKNAIYILDVQKKEIRTIVDEDSGSGFYLGDWSPDGKQLALNGSSIKGGIWLVNSNNTQSPLFIQNGHLLAWFPSDEKVISTKDLENQDVLLYILESKTNDEIDIFSSKGIGISQLSGSSNGSKLAFRVEKDFGNYGIYVFDKNTKKTTQVTSDGDFSYPAISPDGSLIAYTKGDNTGFFRASILYIMKQDGSCSIEVPGHLEVFSPVWSPDGKKIAYIAPNDRGIYLLDLEKVFGKDILDTGLPCP